MKRHPDAIMKVSSMPCWPAAGPFTNHSKLVTSVLLLVATASLLLETGCAEVKPWERGALADYIMIPGRDPIGDMQKEHVFTSREEATGGHAVGGSGCGCN